MFELFTDNAEAVVLHARDEAVTTNCPEIEPAHMLLSILDQDDGVARSVLLGAGVTRPLLAQELALAEPSTREPGPFHNRIKDGALQYSAESQESFQAAERQAQQSQGTKITTEHLLLGLLEADEVQKLMTSLGTDSAALRTTVKEKLRDAG
jgi:ATP-dependent Clp protease ATP-binding subunit ClpA